MDKKKIAAFLIDCEADQLLDFRDYGDHVAAIGPEGKKHIFDSGQLEKGELAMQQDQTLAEAAAKPRRTTTKRKTTTKKKTTKE